MRRGKKVLDVHGIPFDYGKGSVVVFDVTKVVEADRQVEQERRKIYRDVIFSVAGGRLILVEKEELVTGVAGANRSSRWI